MEPEVTGDSSESDSPAHAVGGTPAASSGTVPLFVLGPWLWGTVAVVLAGLLGITGLGLVFLFPPVPPASRLALVDLREASAFGFLRDAHHWASHGLLIAAWLHVFRVFMVGSYRRLLGWTSTVLLLVLVVAMAVTGSRLAGVPGPLPAPSLLAAWAAHCVALPILAIALVTFWWRRRRRSGGGS